MRYTPLIPLPPKMPLVKDCELATEDILVNALRLNKAWHPSEMKDAIRNIEYFISQIRNKHGWVK